MNWGLRKGGVAESGSAAARSFMESPNFREVKTPRPGSIAVMKTIDKQGKENYHSGIYIADYGRGYKILGGNQKNAVNIIGFRKRDDRTFRFYEPKARR